MNTFTVAEARKASKYNIINIKKKYIDSLIFLDATMARIEMEVVTKETLHEIYGQIYIFFLSFAWKNNEANIHV